MAGADGLGPSVNHGKSDLVVYAHGWPPEDEHAELLDPAV